MNPNLILQAGQTADIMGAVQQGNALAGQTMQMRQQNAQNAFLRDNGANLLAGDPGALAQYAQYDLPGAANIQTQNRNNARADEQMAWQRERLGVQDTQDQRADQEWQWKVQEHASKLSQQEREAEAAQIEDAVKMGLAAQTPEQWDQIVTQVGAPDLVGQFDQRDMLTQQYMTVAEILKGQQGPTPQSAFGKFEADRRAGLVPEGAQYKPGGMTVNIGGGDNKQVFDAMAESAVSARSSVTGLSAVSEARKALDGGIISGAGADARLGLQKVGALLGVADPNVIQNTETFRAAIAPQVAAMMKATVGSTQISNADREFAEKASGGSITLDEGSIRRLVDIMERASTAIVQSHGERLNRVYPDGQGFDRERALFGVQVPSAGPPAQRRRYNPHTGEFE